MPKLLLLEWNSIPVIQTGRKLNSAFITLIPKKDGADQVKDFRPISLVHNFANLITKILATRLAFKTQRFGLSKPKCLH
jgi:hypothetical protein